MRRVSLLAALAVLNTVAAVPAWAQEKLCHGQLAPKPEPSKAEKESADLKSFAAQRAEFGFRHDLPYDLWLQRNGAKVKAAKCGKAKTAKAAKKCRLKSPRGRGDKVHLFRSDAKYYEPAGAVSWDVAMTATRPNWKVAVKAGEMRRPPRPPTAPSAPLGGSRWGSWSPSWPTRPRAEEPDRTRVDLPGKPTHGAPCG